MVMIRGTGMAHACQGMTGRSTDRKQKWSRILRPEMPAQALPVADFERDLMICLWYDAASRDCL